MGSKVLDLNTRLCYPGLLFFSNSTQKEPVNLFQKLLIGTDESIENTDYCYECNWCEIDTLKGGGKMLEVIISVKIVMNLDSATQPLLGP